MSAAGNLVDSLMGLIVIVFSRDPLRGVFMAAGKSMFYRNRQKVCSVKRAIFRHAVDTSFLKRRRS